LLFCSSSRPPAQVNNNWARVWHRKSIFAKGFLYLHFPRRCGDEDSPYLRMVSNKASWKLRFAAGSSRVNDDTYRRTIVLRNQGDPWLVTSKTGQQESPARTCNYPWDHLEYVGDCACSWGFTKCLKVITANRQMRRRVSGYWPIVSAPQLLYYSSQFTSCLPSTKSRSKVEVTLFIQEVASSSCEKRKIQSRWWSGLINSWRWCFFWKKQWREKNSYLKIHEVEWLYSMLLSALPFLNLAIFSRDEAERTWLLSQKTI